MPENNSGCGQMIEYIQGSCVICFDLRMASAVYGWLASIVLISS